MNNLSYLAIYTEVFALVLPVFILFFSFFPLLSFACYMKHESNPNKMFFISIKKKSHDEIKFALLKSIPKDKFSR